MNQFKKKNPLPNVRAKLSSLKNLTKKYDENEEMKHIQKSLEKQNKIDDSDMEKNPFLPNDDMEIEIQNRLWSYFLRQIIPYKHKVEKQKINSHQKLMNKILKETDKTLQKNKTHLAQIQCSIKSKYKQTHELFQQIQKIKVQKVAQKQSRRKRDNPDNRYDEKKKVIKENIESLNDEIEDFNEHKYKIEFEIERIQKEKKSFLEHLLKQGYYCQNGVEWILKKMKQIGYRPTFNDFPEFLDKKSKVFLLQLYEQTDEEKVEVRGKTECLKKRSVSEMSLLTKQNHLKDVYTGTKQYLLQLIKKQSFKDDLRLPKIGKPREQINSIGTNTDWKEVERKRINNVYSQELREKVRKIQFGIKLSN